MPLNPTPTTWKVAAIYEDERSCEITLKRTQWRKDLDPDDEEALFVPAEAGEPGAFWEYEGTATKLTLPRHESVMFDVGRQYVLALNEVVDAPLSEYEPA